MYKKANFIKLDLYLWLVPLSIQLAWYFFLRYHIVGINQLANILYIVLHTLYMFWSTNKVFMNKIIHQYWLFNQIILTVQEGKVSLKNEDDKINSSFNLMIWLWNIHQVLNKAVNTKFATYGTGWIKWIKFLRTTFWWGIWKPIITKLFTALLNLSLVFFHIKE